jgi:DNA-binding XRE family transcriptional regulator
LTRLELKGSKNFMDKISKPSDDYLYENRATIGKKIRAFREKKGYSQDDLAEIMDINHSTISKVETGKFAITIDYLAKFAWYLDFNISVIEKQVK